MWGLWCAYAEHGMVGQGLVYNTQMLKHFMSRLDEETGKPLSVGQFYSSDYEEVWQWCIKQIDRYQSD